MAYRYSNVEYTEMVRMLARCDDNVSKACRQYAIRFPNIPTPRCVTMLAATQRLRDYGEFRHAIRDSGRPPRHTSGINLAMSHSLGLLLMMPKMMCGEVALCRICEEFYSEIARAKTNIIWQSSHDKISKRKWKNILRLLDTNFQNMSASGIFPINASLIVQFFKTITTYTIIVLQFRFL
ncbi:uncharacterized protein LOC124641498 [Helicoverpa zea]|uniref:uncharacterized protein LOC124641498 n=1 Tax=Helicoverpa zea TaxID=7113 RepID=UPI001F5970D8|nr:uncharacterized protein LOC124641498 [Helicoverpa zea]